MTQKEAKKIVAKMLQWSMMSQGVSLDVTPEFITEDLETLLRANKIVRKCNEREQARVDKIVKNGGRSYSRKINMVVADRGIAALYVAAKFPGDNPETADILSLHGDNVVICLNKRYINEEDKPLVE